MQIGRVGGYTGLPRWWKGIVVSGPKNRMKALPGSVLAAVFPMPGPEFIGGRGWPGMAGDGRGWPGVGRRIHTRRQQNSNPGR